MHSTRRLFSNLALAAVATLSGFAQAQTPPPTTARVAIQDPWVRASVAGQSGTGAFMRLMAREDLRLVGASSPAAGTVEVHEMKMEGDVMRMRAIPALALPAGQNVELKPGGYHIMLMDLKAPLAQNTAIGLTLLFKDKAGADVRQEVQVPVRLAAPGAAAAPAHGAHKH